MKLTSILIVSLSALLLGGCVGTIRYVKKTPTGGVLAIGGLREDAMKKAASAMAQHCQGAYTVVEEGEVVVGTVTQANSDSNYNSNKSGTAAGASTSSSSSTTNATEYRLTYVCGTQAPAPSDPASAQPTAAPGGSN